MKAARGSSRPPSNLPSLKKKKRKSDQTQTAAGKQNEDLQDNKTKKRSHLKPSAQVKGERLTSALNNTSQKNLRLIQRNCLSALENMMDLAILSSLAFKQKDKKEIQEHLNIMKKRFLAHCSKLRVPAHIQKNLECLSRRQQDESKKWEAVTTTLSTLKEGQKAVVATLEKLEEEIESLQGECRMLTDQVETEEERAGELLQASKLSALNLCVLPPQENEVTLEAQMRRKLPESDSKAIAQKLGRVLQSSEAVRDAQALLHQAHRHTDQLVSAASI